MKGRASIVIFCTIVIVAIAVLASSLHDVRFQPARTVESVETHPSLGSLPPIQLLVNTPLWKIVLYWLAVVINFILFIFLLPPEFRKRLLRQLIGIAVGALVLALAFKYRLIQLPEILSPSAVQVVGTTDGLGQGSDLPRYHIPQVAPWLTYIISLVVLWIVFVLVWVGHRWWRQSQNKQPLPLDIIGRIAQTSLCDLTMGREWGDVVIETYMRMSATVDARRGLRRAAAVTPREFVQQLVQAGLPSRGVSGLTTLFEIVRYGGRRSSASDAEEAIACLESIAQACGGVE
jgi:hypothetical protein